ncbi:ABC transporter substrate-binding protein [Planosporangium mesophilum]|uniref:ABC transporter substrate-binding protein n=1 Tax=Planosporangium mesophilum TaxID=689768 RepID=A0A8J3TSA5_9ACTN|nr:iron-siderophore ABC transporter substrate-binding protein [Planosporangium mesophilum]NJC86859.1 iron-siderophore ABC transporter substrate-binding protein [Planosporangium mesophilum]GII26370.1 ABC transporter substrate-binding protein [Planosporangium mesophilum]
MTLPSLSRRRFTAALAVLPLALGALGALGACGTSATPAAAGNGAQTRTVKTAFGDVTVPAAPKRVIALGDTVLDSALVLGVTPVGTLSSRGGNTVSTYLADKAGSVPIVGTVRETNLEAVVTAKPDLILAAAGTAQAQYDALKAIAPTVVAATTGSGDWESETRTVAAALGQKDRGDQLLADIDKRAKDIAARRAGTGTAAIVRWMPTGPLIMSSSLMAGRLVQLAGDKLPAAANFTDKPHTDPLSLENLSQVDADFIYVATLNADGEKALAAAMAQPAFARLRAAGSGKVATVDGGVWSSAAGPIAAGKVLDDIERLRRAG